jgi:hypothetical protein
VDVGAALDLGVKLKVGAEWQKGVDSKARQRRKVLLMTNWPLRCVVLHNADLSKPDEHQNLIHEASNRDVVCMYLRYSMVYTTHLSPPRSFALLLQLWHARGVQLLRFLHKLSAVADQRIV